MASSPMTSTKSRLAVVLVSDRLDCYDADKDLKTVQKWYKTTEETPIEESSSMKQLEKEAKDQDGKPGSRMEYYLKRAKKSKKSVSDLWKAENVAVLMYTDDDDEGAFFKEFNKASADGNWEPYKFYTALLLSAVRKLAKINPVRTGTYLYRGLRSRLEPPTAKRIFWKTFTSTTSSYDVAHRVFAGDDGVVFEFQPPAEDARASRCAAQVKQLSNHPDEEEIIILPFEAFDVVITSDPEEPCYFKTSETQELLK